MNLEQKLAQLKKAAKKDARDGDLERQFEYLRRMAEPTRPLPAERVSQGIEEYVEGQVEANAQGEFFLAHQSLPFGRPYGKMRIADLAAADLNSLELVFAGVRPPDPSRLIYLDTETTGLAGGTGTVAFLIGVGAVEGSQFVVRQIFLRNYPEEKSALAALSEMLSGYEGIVTFNGKTFDIPLLETRYTLARMKSPFARMQHFDLLHPARRLWKLRLTSCELTNLERRILGITREGDVDGADIPRIYFDYLRSGQAQYLQPVFYHNALDIVTLAALGVEMARALREEEGALDSSLDLFSLSRILERAQVADRAAAACREALRQGLPVEVESRALWQLAAQHKRKNDHIRAVELWTEIARRDDPLALHAMEALAIYFEHRERDAAAALTHTRSALDLLRAGGSARKVVDRFDRRRARLARKISLAASRA